jgi:hypothetical protein
MRTSVKLILVVTGIAVFGLGFLTARLLPSQAAATDNEPRIRFRAGDQKVFAPVPELSEWRYPGSKEHHGAGPSTFKDMGIEFSLSQRAILATPDDFDKVCDYYKTKCDLRDPGSQSAHWRDEGGGSATDYWITLYEAKHGNWFTGPARQGVRSMGFHVSTTGYHLVGFISRGATEPTTEIVLVYRPLSEFMSVAKQLQLKEK